MPEVRLDTDGRDSLRGLTIEETPLINPITEQPIPVQRQNLVLSDPRTGAIIILERAPVIQCYAGDLIEAGLTLAFCSACGKPTCTRHSVQDPFCGRVFCLPHSRITEVQGIPLRVCECCYRRLRDRWVQKLVRFLLGRK